MMMHDADSASHGLVFTTQMTMALLARRKTETRRLLNRPPPLDWSTADLRRAQERWLDLDLRDPAAFEDMPAGMNLARVYDKGDVLYVKESHMIDKVTGEVIYKASSRRSLPWSNPRFCPRRVARIYLDVEEVREERLHDMTTESVAAEGIPESTEEAEAMFLLSGRTEKAKEAARQDWAYLSPLQRYARLWDMIHHGRACWDANPWVRVTRFRVTDESPTQQLLWP